MGCKVQTSRHTLDGVVSSGPAVFAGATLRATTAAAATVLIYDNASAASGTVIAEGQTDAAGATVRIGPPDGKEVYCTQGIYVDVGGTTPACIVYFNHA